MGINDSVIKRFSFIGGVAFSLVMFVVATFSASAMADGHAHAKKHPDVSAWNRMTISCVGQQIDVVLNGKHVTVMDMALWNSGEKNPDGSDIPPCLPNTFSGLPTKGKIGLQGKHAGAPVWFRNVKVKELGEK